jgi:hypothetical protein
LFGRRAVARARWLGAHLEAQNTPREQRSAARRRCTSTRSRF